MMRFILMYTIYLPYNLKMLFCKLFKRKIKDSYKHHTYYFEIPKKSKVNNTVNIKCSYVPERKTIGSAAVDLIAQVPSTGLIFRAGKCGLLLMRSGLSIQSPLGLANGVGLIDSDYRGEIKVPMRNYSSQKRHTISNGERIAQLLIVDYFTPTLNRVKELKETVRNEGGFGSTGTK
jgi:deoxyuridine 5'-triphosphate nucleotidohydrolase